jgi:hypothetical protein
VLRVASALALAASPEARGHAPILERLSADAAIVAELLGKDHERLVAYVKSLQKGAARGRTVDEILSDEDVRSSFLHEVTGWATSYTAPAFGRDEKNLDLLERLAEDARAARNRRRRRAGRQARRGRPMTPVAHPAL